MTTTTNVPQIKLNIMTQAQYDSATKSPTELYMITDANSGLVNSATGLDSLTINGIATSYTSSINIGHSSVVNANNAVVIGVSASANALSSNSIAIGNAATVAGQYAIQLGKGTNNEANSFYVGLSNSNNYKLLGSDGIIPQARLASGGTNEQVLSTNGINASWTSIKTINNQSLVGSGNIEIQGGSVEDSILKGNTAPTSDTFADFDGQTYLDTTNKQGYICTNKTETLPLEIYDSGDFIYDLETLQFSNFSTTNYLTNPNPFTADTQDKNWEAVFAFTTSSETFTRTTAYVILVDSNTSEAKNFRLCLYKDSGRELYFRAEAGYDGDIEYTTIKGTTALEVDTKYWAKVTYDTILGYKLYISTDGIDYLLEGESSIVTPLGVSGDLCIGDNYDHRFNYFKGESIDLGNSYIKIDGVNVFPYKTTTSWKKITLNTWGEITGTLSNQTDLQNVLNEKQETLESGVNIKTINNQSLLGSGNIEIQGGTGTITDVKVNNTSVVTDGVAEIDLTDYLKSSDIEEYTSSEIETLWESL